MSMADRDGVIGLMVKCCRARNANVACLTHSLHYGMAVFEGVRALQYAGWHGLSLG